VTADLHSTCNFGFLDYTWDINSKNGPMKSCCLYCPTATQMELESPLLAAAGMTGADECSRMGLSAGSHVTHLSFKPDV
jgi:hypothetical protein